MQYSGEAFTARTLRRDKIPLSIRRILADMFEVVRYSDAILSSTNIWSDLSLASASMASFLVFSFGEIIYAE